MHSVQHACNSFKFRVHADSNVSCNRESFIVPCSGTSVTADKFKRVGDKEKVLWKHRDTRRKCGLGMCADWDVLL